ncbi:acetyl/propionyl/methylcrotonyl-CoA carboxylase subunit alpha [Dyella amyloliquefaciens]|uniref:acetyl/propionyl/methylcrotonyl-CoA carboxylase subunit alpha n=1 Tax=Dyella amyloliquefaciens TaxID=1770545 RepID=UPI00102E3E6F|nr:acetyl/propionyl/methylcrotonyl-CoA carboxylase subunit alpha [Dyella amyloliquefaciens]
MFSKILIANRGEIACRIIGTCRRLGIRTVAVYSEADSNARHVKLADEAWCVGPAPARDSYLQAERILEVALASGAKAVHPGYGFLSENESFAKACSEAGITFIGPPIEAIHAMGSKSAAKAMMAAAGVPLVPGYHGDEQGTQHLHQQADRMGYPVLIKASAGGGGKGMRVVEQSADFPQALASCQREAQASFGDDKVLIEKYLDRPRHVEIQVFGDEFGDIIHLNERDCSTQRRHQKVVEEAPAPGMSAERRAIMGKAACDAARAVGYVGAGTVEFIVDRDDAFYFMEMNTRLQVEHPVTEMITGLDLVEWQLRIAAGQPLPLAQAQVPLRGHAIEVRLYAEDPNKGFLPSIGRLVHLRTPAPSPHIRIDSGVEQGSVVSPHYDPMLAKLIVWAETRAQAIDRMLHALSELQIVGVSNNVTFLSRLVDHADFRSGCVDTGLIERDREQLLAPAPWASAEALAAAAMFMVLQESSALQAHAQSINEPQSPWARANGWRMLGPQIRCIAFREAGKTENTAIAVHYTNSGIEIAGKRSGGYIDSTGRLHLSWGKRQLHADVVRDGNTVHVFMDGEAWVLTLADPLMHAGEERETQGGLRAPMPGNIIALLVEPGSRVTKGAPLLVMEAMKMEHTLTAPADGVVRGFFCQVGSQVRESADLVDFEPDA